jgi:hypothetical protein
VVTETATRDCGTIAARAALRVLPLVAIAIGLGSLDRHTAAAFRGIALARAAGKYPARANELRAGADAARAAALVAGAAATAGLSDDAKAPSRLAAAAAAFAAASGAAAADFVGAFAAGAKLALGYSYILAIDTGFGADAGRAANAASAAIWAEVRTDAMAVARQGAAAVADQPLSSQGSSDWAVHYWAKLQGKLPKGQDWDVWIDWYEERLRGVRRGKAYDLVFATVPKAEWDKGPAAANAWIKAHLPKAP